MGNHYTDIELINCSASKNITLIPNNILMDPNISFKAKGVYCALAIIIPDEDREISYFEDLKMASTDGETAIRSAVAELADAGYFRLFRYRDKKTKKWEGSFAMITKVPNHFDIAEPAKDIEELGLECPEIDKMLKERGC